MRATVTAEEGTDIDDNVGPAPDGPMVRPYVGQAGWGSHVMSSPSRLTTWGPASQATAAIDDERTVTGSVATHGTSPAHGLALPALPLLPQLQATVLPSPAAASTISSQSAKLRPSLGPAHANTGFVASQQGSPEQAAVSTAAEMGASPLYARVIEAESTRHTDSITALPEASGATLSVPPVQALRSTSSASSVEVVPGSSSGILSGAFLCEVVILAAELPPEFDSGDFYSAISFTAFSQTNAEVASVQPHRFVVHTEDALSQNYVHIMLQPRDSANRFSQEFETFLPLAHVVERFGLGQGRCIALGMVPRGSGAAPSAIFQYCCCQNESRSAGRELGGHAARISLACSIQQRPGSLWDQSADLDWPVHEGLQGKGSSSGHLARYQGQGQEDTSGEREAPTSDDWDSQAACDAQGCNGQGSPCSPSQQSAGQLRSPGATEEGACEEVDEQQWLQEELKRARNELRMQQTLMNFQERRLQVFEAQSNAVAAAGAASEAYDQRMQNPEIHEQLRLLGDTVQTQQEEIHHLREHLAFYSSRSEHLWQQTAAQRRLEHALQQSQARMKYEIDAREQRIHELEMALQERDQQLDMIPDAVDSILRSPPRFQEEFMAPTPGSMQSSPHRFPPEPYVVRSGSRPQSSQHGYASTVPSAQARAAHQSSHGSPKVHYQHSNGHQSPEHGQPHDPVSHQDGQLSNRELENVEEHAELPTARPSSASPQRAHVQGSWASAKPKPIVQEQSNGCDRELQTAEQEVETQEKPPEARCNGQSTTDSSDYGKDPLQGAESKMGPTLTDAECFTYLAVDLEDSLDKAVAATVLRLALPASCFNGHSLQRISEGKYRFGEQRYVFRQLEDGKVYVRLGGRFISIEEWLHAEVEKSSACWRQDEVDCRSSSPTASTADSHRGEFGDIHCY